MILPIIILSIVFIVIAFLVTENNAKQLLSGYNTMSEEERKHFDLKSYLPFFRNFHVFLGITLFVFSFLIYYYINSDWSGLFLGVYPIFLYVYFIWKCKKFSKTTSKKENILTNIGISMLILLIVYLVFNFTNALSDNHIIIQKDKIKIEGEYGIELNVNEIKSIFLIDKLPEIRSKINGFELQNVKKGYFITKQEEKIKLLINSGNKPIIVFITKNNEKTFYTSKDKSSKVIFKELKKNFFLK